LLAFPADAPAGGAVVAALVVTGPGLAETPLASCPTAGIANGNPIANARKHRVPGSN
jgi:hypothetical protein